MTSIDIRLEDEDKALILLSSLLSSAHLVIILLYGKDTIDLEEITEAILSDKLRKNGSSNDIQVKDLMI